MVRGRRLVKHALVGVGALSVTASLAVALVGSPTGQTAALASPEVFGVAVTADAGEVGAQQTAIREAAAEDATRSRQRAALDALAAAQADKRDDALAEAGAAATKKNAALVKARKARIAKQKAAEKARLAKIKAQGYEPGTTDPKEMARQILENTFGYGADQFSCFNNIIIRESNWDVDATNASSGAYGIPQALPGSKMASVADDWRTNPATQIIWAVHYMDDRYGSPCSAWGFKSANGWY